MYTAFYAIQQYDLQLLAKTTTTSVMLTTPRNIIPGTDFIFQPQHNRTNLGNVTKSNTTYTIEDNSI